VFQSDLPRDIIRLVRDPAPPLPILLVKGPPGCGKTTFLLQLFDLLGREAVLDETYVNGLDSRPRLFARHGSILRSATNSVEKRGALRKISRGGLKRLLESVRAGHMGRELMQQIVADRDPEEGPYENAPSSKRAPEIGDWVDWNRPAKPTPPAAKPQKEAEDPVAPEFPEIEGLYGHVERTTRLPAFLALDSIDALARHYGIPAARLVAALQQDLVEPGHAILVCVVDRAGTSALDSLADATVSFDRASRSDHQQVVATIDRLRGREIGQSRYSFRFRQNRLIADPTDAEIVDRLLGERLFSDPANPSPE
jgi:hypothetical protein